MNDGLCRVSEDAIWSRQVVAAMAQGPKSCLSRASLLSILYHTPSGTHLSEWLSQRPLLTQHAADTWTHFSLEHHYPHNQGASDLRFRPHGHRYRFLTKLLPWNLPRGTEERQETSERIADDLTSLKHKLGVLRCTDLFDWSLLKYSNPPYILF
jgi:hypothetical protein